MSSLYVNKTTSPNNIYDPYSCLTESDPDDNFKSGIYPNANYLTGFERFVEKTKRNQEFVIPLRPVGKGQVRKIKKINT